MQAVDFKYDDRLLSDIGFMIVDFDSGGGFMPSTAGSELSLSTFPQYGGRRHALTSVKYETPFEASIGICKTNGSEVSVDEYRYIERWLNRKEFLELIVFQTDYESIHFFGTFYTSEKIVVGGRLVGFRLTFATNAPFGFGDQVTDSFVLGPNAAHVIKNDSDEDGEIAFDSLEITCRGSGTLTLENHFDNKVTTITGCTNGEVITFNGKTLTVTSSTGRNIYDSFNFVYPRLVSKVRTEDESDTRTDFFIMTLDGRELYARFPEDIVTQGGIFITTQDGKGLVTEGGRSNKNILVSSTRVNHFSSNIQCSVVAKFTPIRKVVF